MDYEKKYNETLERSKSIKDSIIASHNKESASYYTGFIDNIFPELADSKDERIRKWLIDMVSYGNWRKGWPFGPDEVVAYLEKQKEQKPFMCDGEIEDKKRDIVAAIRKYYPADYAAYLTSFLKRLLPEDNSEDEYGQEMLGIAYKLMYEHIPENLRTQEFWDSLKFMREYTGKVAIIHSYEQPAEWNEEDEINKDLAIGKLEGTEVDLDYDVTQQVISWLKWLPNRYVPGGKFTICIEHSRGYQEGLKAGREELKQDWSEEEEKMRRMALECLDHISCESKIPVVNWLKSIRLQPHWKPSEEQIESLTCILGMINSDKLGKNKNAFDSVIELYNDLKNLR